VSCLVNRQVLWEDGSFFYRPEVGYVGPDSFTYRLTDGRAVSNVATVSLNMQPVNDIALIAFYPDGTDLSVEYFVTGDQVGPFNITVSAITAGQTAALPLEVWPGDASPGRHTLRIAPTFVDPQSDYSLVAQVDSGNSVTENSEDNTTAALQPGAFVVHETAAGGSGQAVLHIEGSDAADPVSVAATEYNRWQVLMPRSSVSVPGGSSPPPYYDVIGNGIVNMMDIAAPPHSDLLWQNANRFDVNRDYYTTAADALAIINALNAWGERALYDQPQASDPLYDVSGDGILSVLDANQVIDVLNGGDGTVGAPWRNPVNPFDVNGDGTVGWLGEAQPILDFLALGQINYTNLALDQIHIRTHGGDDTAAVDGAIAWLFGGAGDNTLTGGSSDNYISAGDGANIIHGGIGENTIEVGDGNNAITGGAGDDDIIAGNGANNIHSGDGNDYIGVGNGENTVDGGDGLDSIDTGTGDNAIESGAADEINGLVERPSVQIDTDSQDVIEGDSLTVTALLSGPTDHDVTVAIAVQAENPANTLLRWQQSQVTITVPAGQWSGAAEIQTVDNAVLDGSDVSTVTLVNPDGADLADDPAATVFVWDNDDKLGLDWWDDEDPDRLTSFSGEIVATRLGNGTLQATGTDDYGRPFTAYATIDNEGVIETIDLTVQGDDLPSNARHWTGTSDGFEEHGGRFPMFTALGNGVGNFAVVLAAKPLPNDAACNCAVINLQGTANGVSNYTGRSYKQSVQQLGTLNPITRTVDITASNPGFLTDWGTGKGKLTLQGNYGTNQLGEHYFLGVTPNMTGWSDSLGGGYGLTGMIYDTAYIKNGEPLTEDTVLHQASEGGRYCTEVNVVIVGVRRLTGEPTATFGIGIGPISISASGASVSIPAGAPFSVKVGVTTVQNAKALKNGFYVGGDPDFVMAVAVAADGQTLAPKQIETKVSSDEPGWNYVGNGVYQRIVNKLYCRVR